MQLQSLLIQISPFKQNIARRSRSLHRHLEVLYHSAQELVLRMIIPNEDAVKLEFTLHPNKSRFEIVELEVRPRDLMIAKS